MLDLNKKIYVHVPFEKINHTSFENETWVVEIMCFLLGLHVKYKKKILTLNFIMPPTSS
jgi:hypothetical protein